MSDKNNLDALIQVDAKTHYITRKYLNARRLASIGYQLEFLNGYFPESHVLEVGVGTGVTADLLGKLGHDVTTLDIDPELKPDLVGSVTDIPAEDGALPCFLCSQVLEHLPWPESQKALRELRRVSSEGGVLSVPTVVTQFGIRWHGFSTSRPNRTLRIPLPELWTKKMCVQGGQHYWELGAGVTKATFRKAVRDAGFIIEKEMQPIENPFHHFFVVRNAAE